MSVAKALIIDDESDLRELLRVTLKRMDLDVAEAEDVASAKEMLSKDKFDVCFTDLKLPDGDGLQIVQYIQQVVPELPVAVITAHGSMEIAIQALKFGAFDFVSKPINLKMLRDLVSTALRLKTVGEPLHEETQKELLGVTEAMTNLRSQIAKLARSQAPVFISGQSGVGKELVARLIHEQGPRSNAEFVPVNCGAIPEDLMESEFFGHKRGSFTGAVSDKDGLFQAANGGTLFLDEVADLPLNMQVKLLRAIQEKAVRPVGDQREVTVDVRILSATHQNLSKLVSEGQFRQDLFYRINVIELKVPSLSERPEDIPILTDHILTHLSQQQHLPKPEISAAALERLHGYAFPGNIRELENILERAFTLCEGNDIEPDDLQLEEHEEDIQEQDLAEQALPAAEKESDENLDIYLDDVERDRIIAALEKTRWNKTAAAKLLGISFRALRYRLQKYNIQ